MFLTQPNGKEVTRCNDPYAKYTSKYFMEPFKFCRKHNKYLSNKESTRKLFRERAIVYYDGGRALATKDSSEVKEPEEPALPDPPKPRRKRQDSKPEVPKEDSEDVGPGLAKLNVKQRKAIAMIEAIKEDDPFAQEEPQPIAKVKPTLPSPDDGVEEDQEEEEDEEEVEEVTSKPSSSGDFTHSKFIVHMGAITLLTVAETILVNKAGLDVSGFSTDLSNNPDFKESLDMCMEEWSAELMQQFDSPTARLGSIIAGALMGRYIRNSFRVVDITPPPPGSAKVEEKKKED